jgi:hypothetical protein
MSTLNLWGKVAAKIAEQVQGRIERLKNERADLIKERQAIYDGPYSEKSSNRVYAINDRIDRIDGMLRSNAHD